MKEKTLRKKMSTNLYRILNRFFSRRVLIDLLENGTNEIYHVCVNRFLAGIQTTTKSNLEVIEQLYTVCQNYYRNEYYYKNTILRNILLGRHNLRTTVALNELPIANAKADVVLINGVATVYEVKSEFDNLDRLNIQLSNYYKAFDTVYVVTNEENEAKVVRKIKKSAVGIIILNNKTQLSKRKEAIADTSKLSNESIFKILRKNEYENIIINFFGKLPTTSEVRYYRECLRMVNKINTLEFYKLAIAELKKRNISHPIHYLSYVPHEIKYPIYFSNLNVPQYERLHEFLSANYGG